MPHLTVPEDAPGERVSRWSLTMAWWSLFSAMFWLYVSAASTAAYGARSTLIGMVLSILVFGAINQVLSTYSMRTGQTVVQLSARLFGRFGSTLAAVLVAATALYYGVFEGSVIAASLQLWFGGSINAWYLVCVAYAMPMAFGGVRHWLDRLNGVLLPFYVVGLFALVLVTISKHGTASGWLSTPGLPSSVPGWLGSFLVYMGIWVMMLFTIDFAALGKPEDAKFHRHATFGPLFYACTFGVNGLIGMFVVTASGVGGTESGVVEAVVGALGIFGVLLIVVSQTRINSANYYIASSNLEAIVKQTVGVDLPRIAWVLICGVLAYSLMLTDVLSYLLTALSWQAVLIVAWVGVALTHIVMRGRGDAGVVEASTAPLATRLMGAWIASSVIGLVFLEQDAHAALAVTAPLSTFVISALLTVMLASSTANNRAMDPVSVV